MPFTDLLFDPLSLQVYRRKAHGRVGGAPLNVRDLHGHDLQIDADQLEALSARQAREALQELTHDQAWQREWLSELPASEVTPLLSASSADEFIQALMAWRGTTDPKELEDTMLTLEQRAQQAAALVNAGFLPPVPSGEGRAGTQPSPLLLGWLALVRAAGENPGAQAETADQPAAAPLRISVSPPALDFSAKKMWEVLGRTPPGEES